MSLPPRPASQASRAKQSRLVIVTGERGSGKTIACLELIERARRAGLDRAGLVSPATFADGVRTGADVVDIRTGERRPFTFEGSGRRFDRRVVAWASKRLERACPCDLLVVDEIGPLELIHQRGWRNALDVVGSGGYGLAVVVVRPKLLDVLLGELEERLPNPSWPPKIVSSGQLCAIEFDQEWDHAGAAR